jgi:hypothetical protein
MVENDARWAYRFQRKFSEKLKDRDDIYLEVKTSEELRKRKGLPPRVVILPDWDMSDEDRYDDEQSRRKARTREETSDAAKIEGSALMKKSNLRSPAALEFIPGRRYRGVQGKVVHWVEHSFEEGLLYIHVRFTDKTELSWRITTRMAIEESDLADWTSGDFKQLRVFVRNERDRSM